MWGEQLKALPEPLQAAVIAAPLSLGSMVASAGSEALSTDSLMPVGRISALAAVGAYAAPMISADPMLQVGASAGVGAAGGYLLGGSPLIDGLIAGGSLYIARMLTS